MAERPDQFLVYLALLTPVLVAVLILIPARGWHLGRWTSGAVWSGVGLTVLGTVPVVLVEWEVLRALIRLLGNPWSGLVVSLVVLSYVEEALKIVAIWLTALAFRRSLAQQPAMYLAIGVGAGIAFATLENVLFLTTISDRAPDMLWRVTILRMVGPTPMHVVAAMVAAWYVARARAGHGGDNLVLALIFAGTLHLLFNGAQILGDALGGTRVPLGSTAHVVTFALSVAMVALAGIAVLRRRNRVPPPRLSIPAAPGEGDSGAP
jgi:hypothetical protein